MESPVDMRLLLVDRRSTARSVCLQPVEGDVDKWHDHDGHSLLVRGVCRLGSDLAVAGLYPASIHITATTTPSRPTSGGRFVKAPEDIRKQDGAFRQSLIPSTEVAYSRSH
jgi:hypothetical protein